MPKDEFPQRTIKRLWDAYCDAVAAERVAGHQVMQNIETPALRKEANKREAELALAQVRLFRALGELFGRRP